MKKISTLIVDDEQYGRDNLRYLVTQFCPSVELIGAVGSMDDAQHFIINHKPQLVLLDIIMPNGSGLELLARFPERDFLVVFVTASIDFGIRAVKAGVLDYIIKPISPVELTAAIQKVAQSLEANENPHFSPETEQTRIALAHATGFTLEDVDNIVRLQADDNYTDIFTAVGKKYTICRPLADFEKSLPRDIFVRVHKTHMINLRFLRDFTRKDGGIAILNDGQKIPVSKRKSGAFLDVVKRFSLMLRN